MRAADLKNATVALDEQLMPELKKFARQKDVEELLEVEVRTAQAYDPSTTS